MQPCSHSAPVGVGWFEVEHVGEGIAAFGFADLPVFCIVNGHGLGTNGFNEGNLL